MSLLNAALAFAVVMIIFSTVTTGIVEVIHQLFGLRQRVLRRSLDRLFDTVLWPLLQDALSKGLGGDMADVKSNVLNSLLDNPAERKTLTKPQLVLLECDAGSVLCHLRNVVKVYGYCLRWLAHVADKVIDVFGKRGARALTPEEFLTRLARTDIGKTIISDAKTSTDDVLRDILSAFDTIGQAATSYFRGRAILLAIPVSVVMALTLNIDAVRLFKSFARNPVQAEAYIKQGEAAYKEHQAQLDNLVKTQDRLNTLNTPGGNKATQAAMDAEFTKLKQNIDAIGVRLGELSKQDLPIGDAYFPHCAVIDIDADCAKPETIAAASVSGFNLLNYDGTYIKNWLAWALRAIFTGFLIGLGGPFWFQTFNSLSKVRQAIGVVSALRPKARAGGADQATAASANAVPAPDPEQKMIDNFKNSATNAVKSTVAGRLDIDENGDLVREHAS